MPPGRLARPLLPLTLAYVGGLIAARLGLNFPLPGLAATGVVLLILLGLAWLGRKPGGILGLALFWLCGLGGYQLASTPPLPPHHVARLPHGQPFHFIGTLDSLPHLRRDGASLEVAISSCWGPGGWRPVTGRVRLHLPPQAVVPTLGDQLAFTARLRPVTNVANPGSFDRRMFLARKEIFVQAVLPGKSEPVRLHSPGGLDWQTRWVGSLRARYQQLLQRQPQPASSLFQALLIGEQGDIPPEVLQNFSRTGTSHVFSVGGMHMALLAGSSFALAFLVIRGFPGLLLRVNAVKVATVFSLGPVGFYTLMAGGSPPAQRAALMILVFLILILLERQRDLPTILTLAALIILVISPLTLFTLSFQLSYLCILGLAYLLPRWLPRLHGWLGEGNAARRGWRRPVFWGVEGLAAALAATLATLPLVVTYFHQVPTYGLVANLLIIPLFGAATVSLGLAALIVAPLSEMVANALLAAGRLPITLGLKIIEGLAGWPGSFIVLPTPTPWQIFAYYLVLICLFSPRRSLWTKVGVGVGGVILVGTVGLSYLTLKSSTALEVSAIDTRGEMAALITFPGGVRMVVSAGGPAFREPSDFSARVLTSYLHHRQVRRVDYLVSLATTRQNAPSLWMVSQDFDARELWYEGGRLPFRPWVELRNCFGDRNRPVVNLAFRPPPEDIAGATLSVWQDKDPATGRTAGPVALTVVFRGTRLLFLPPARRQWYDNFLAHGQPIPYDIVWLGKWLEAEDWWRAFLSHIQPNLVVWCGLPPGKGPPQVPDQSAIKFHTTAAGEVQITVGEDGWQVQPQLQGGP